jgi:hypothetical protein
MGSIDNGWTPEWEERRQAYIGNGGPSEEVVDPVEQLAMSLAWEEDYTDAYKVRVLTDAIEHVMRGR